MTAAEYQNSHPAMSDRLYEKAVASERAARASKSRLETGSSK